MGIKSGLTRSMLRDWLKNLRYRFSRSKWAAKLLNFPCEPAANPLPGVLMIQIDGLSFPQFEKALQQNRLPFIRGLLNRDLYTAQPFYSGVPSTTPAVQAELFFGKKSAVPAFEFYNRDKKERHVMFRPQSVAYVTHRLEQTEQPLLWGGRSYGNIYAGGAEEARYCVESMKLESLLKSLRPLRFFFLIILYFTKVVRILAYAMLELGLGITDFFRGILQRNDLFKEMKFIPTRVFICIILRELIRLRVKMDAEKGVRIIHANLVGYDEQAHRRGPDSKFAMWTLKGIDDVIKDIYRTALKCRCRDYELIIYADHGQEKVISYEKQFGRPIETVVRRTLAEKADFEPLSGRLKRPIPEPDMKTGTRWSRSKGSSIPVFPVDPGQIQVTTSGPLGHVYLPDALKAGDLENMAERLVKTAHVPNVLFLKQEQIWVVDGNGAYVLDAQPARFLGSAHPFLSASCEDLKQVVAHPLAGDLVISGWRQFDIPMSFSTENGAHGGPGKNETQGFMLLPKGLKSHKKTFRPMDLRKLVLNILKPDEMPVPPAQTDGKGFTFRVLSYNIHSCINLRRKVDLPAVAEVIGQYFPDIVALQEVDRNKRRSGFSDQAKYLAEYLGMHYDFLPLLRNGDEAYGLAILSRYPYEKVKLDRLEITNPNKKGEPRGAIWIKFMTPYGAVDFINTHLGLTVRERMLQIQTLLGKDWCRNFAQADPMILCGDFNAGPRSPVYREIRTCLSDVQETVGQAGYPRATFMSMYPIFRIDHIFVSRHLKPVNVHVPATLRARMASDHLPVFAELQFVDN